MERAVLALQADQAQTNRFLQAVVRRFEEADARDTRATPCPPGFTVENGSRAVAQPAMPPQPVLVQYRDSDDEDMKTEASFELTDGRP